MVTAVSAAQDPATRLIRRWAEAVAELGSSDLGALSTDRLLLSAAIVLGIWLLRALVVRAIEGRVRGERTRYRWRKVTGRVAFVATAGLVGVVWIDWVRSLGTLVGLLVAGLTIALREPVAGVAGWCFILLRRPFGVGDRIQVGEHTGDVVDIRVLDFSILEVAGSQRAEQSTGRIVHIPTGTVFTRPVANYSAEFDFIWDELPVTVTFESDWKRAKGILEEIVEGVAGTSSAAARTAIAEAGRRQFVFFSALEPCVYTSGGEHGIVLSLRYLCPARQRRATAERIWERVLDRFAQEGAVQLAYPTRRVFQRSMEGGRSTRADPPSA